MILDVTQELKEFTGEPIKTSEQVCVACRRPVDTGEPLTLRLVLTRALIHKDPQKPFPFKDQMEHYDLARRIADNGEVEIDVGEAGRLQGLVAAIYGPLVTGQAGWMLEGKSSS